MSKYDINICKSIVDQYDLDIILKTYKGELKDYYLANEKVKEIIDDLSKKYNIYKFSCSINSFRINLTLLLTLIVTASANEFLKSVDLEEYYKIANIPLKEQSLHQQIQFILKNVYFNIVDPYFIFDINDLNFTYNPCDILYGYYLLKYIDDVFGINDIEMLINKFNKHILNVIS